MTDQELRAELRHILQSLLLAPLPIEQAKEQLLDELVLYVGVWLKYSERQAQLAILDQVRKPTHDGIWLNGMSEQSGASKMAEWWNQRIDTLQATLKGEQ